MNPEAWFWRIVLVRPRNPLNIGAAARAMANFGFRELVVVNPYEPTWQEARSAVGAEDVVGSARAVPSLMDAIGDARLVAGTTSGSRRHLARELVPLAELPAWIAEARRGGSRGRPFQQTVTTRAGPRPAPGSKIKAASRSVLRAALLFGSEKTGLSNEEMSHCRPLVRVPTSPGCPSMNLGQAVAVCCYELARQGVVSKRAPSVRAHRSEPATRQSLEHLFDRAARVLDAAGYLKPQSRAATQLKLRQTLLALGLTQYDARIVGGALAQVEWKLGVLAG